MGIHILFVMLYLLDSILLWSTHADIFNIVTSPNSSCDSNLTCYTLGEYASRANLNVSDNITLELQSGPHHLNSSLTLASNVNYFTIRGNMTASVSCNPGPSNYFFFSQQQQITVSDITFINCRMELQSITSATFVRSSFMVTLRDSGSNPVLKFISPRIPVQIEECIFLKYTTQANNNRGIYLKYGSMSIFSSNFSGFLRSSMTGHGGAIFASAAKVTIISSYFTNNGIAGTTDTFGGAVAYIHQGILTIMDSYFSNNIVGASGGVINAIEAEINIDSSNFYNNRAGGIGGTIYSSGGNLTVINTYFTNSTAIYNGGAIHAASGKLNISNSHFANNSAANLGGAAVYCFDGELSIINSSFHNNNANSGGRCAAVCTESGKGLLIHDSIFNASNVANIYGQSGGALYISDSESVSIAGCHFNNNAVVLGNQSGGAIFVYQGEVIISNSSFIENNIASGSSSSGSALYIHDGNVTVRNNSFCNKKPDFDYIYVARGNITVTDNYFIVNDAAICGDHYTGIVRFQHILCCIRSIKANSKLRVNTTTDYCRPNATADDNFCINATTSSSVTTEILAAMSEQTAEPVSLSTKSNMKGESIVSLVNLLPTTEVTVTTENVTSTIQVMTTIIVGSTPTEGNTSTTITSAAAVTTSTSVTTTLSPLTTTESTTSPPKTNTTEEVIITKDGDSGPSCNTTCIILVSFVGVIFLICMIILLCILCCIIFFRS